MNACPKCGNWLLERNEDKDFSCLRCGKVLYVHEIGKPVLTREPRHDLANKLKAGVER